MKRIVLIVSSFTFFFLSAAAQDNKDKDTSIKRAAVSICKCLEKNHIEKAATEEEMQQVFLQCIFDSASSVIGDVLLTGGEGDMKENGAEFGQKIALELMNSGCQPFIQMSLKLAKNNMGGDGTEVKPELKTADGTVTKVEEKDLLYITVKQSTGREIVLMYMEYVDGSDGWIKDAASKLVSKSVSVYWAETEIYQPKIKDFANMKVLKKLEIK